MGVAADSRTTDLFSNSISGTELSNLQLIGKLSIKGQDYLIISKKFDDPPDESLRQEMPSQLLTRRERQIAAMVADGYVNKQIAHLLTISEWTISTHLRRIYAKLRVKTRAAMVAKLSRSTSWH